MRTIKFRIWDKQLKAFLYRLPEKHHLDWERFDVQQFTGLLDSKGKEIYEGDIIKFWEENFIEPITYSGCTFIAGKNGTGVPVDSLDCEKSVEVIGNIYENPELI